jgi:hypothetical protein
MVPIHVATNGSLSVCKLTLAVSKRRLRKLPLLVALTFSEPREVGDDTDRPWASKYVFSGTEPAFSVEVVLTA